MFYVSVLWLECHVAAGSMDQCPWFQWQGLNFSLKKDVILVLAIEIQALGGFLSTSPVLCYFSVFCFKMTDGVVFVWTNNLCSWMATVGEKVESSTVPTSVPVRVALELLQAGHRYLDVR